MLHVLTLALALVTAVGATSAVDTPVSLTISYVDCPKNIYTPNELRLLIFDQHGTVVLRRSFPRIAAAAIRQVEVSLLPGFYNGVVATKDCGDELLITLLQNHDRHVSAIGRSSAVLRTYRSMLSGTLPFSGVQAAIVYKNRKAVPGQSSSPDGYWQFPASVEGDAYYAIGLPDGDATVRLYNQGDYRWLDFDAGRIDRTKGDVVLIRNISIQNVDDKLQSMSRDHTICVPGKGGVTICTPPA